MGVAGRVGVVIRWWALIRILPCNPVSYQVRGEVDKVCVVFVDEFHHGALESTKIRIQVLSETLDSDPLSALADEFVHVKVSVQERVGGEA